MSSHHRNICRKSRQVRGASEKSLRWKLWCLVGLTRAWSHDISSHGPPQATQRGMSNFLSLLSESAPQCRCSLRSSCTKPVTHATPPLAEARKARQDDSRTSASLVAAPYEKRLMELLKVGRDKRALESWQEKGGTTSRVCSTFSFPQRGTQTYVAVRS